MEFENISNMDSHWVKRTMEVKEKVKAKKAEESRKKAAKASNMTTLLKKEIEGPDGLKIPKPKLSFYILLENAFPLKDLAEISLSVENVALILYLLANQDEDKCTAVLAHSPSELKSEILKFSSRIRLDEDLEAYIEAVRLLFVQTWAASEILREELEKKTVTKMDAK